MIDEQHQSFDICILCALHEEASAVLDEFATRCGVPFTKAFRGQNKFEYRHATIQNRHGDRICLSISPTILYKEAFMQLESSREHVEQEPPNQLVRLKQVVTQLLRTR